MEKRSNLLFLVSYRFLNATFSISFYFELMNHSHTNLFTECLKKNWFVHTYICFYIAYFKPQSITLYLNFK